MYFEFSGRKLGLLLIIGFFMASGLAIYTFVNSATNLTILTEEYLQRQTAYASYWLQFKLPQTPQVAAAAFSGTVTTSALPPTSADGQAYAVPVLVYHGEGDVGTVNMPQRTFVEQMRALKDAGWHTITMQQFTDFMQGTATLPAKSFLLTFDDGRRDTFYAMDPVLKDLGFNAVMFVITGFSLPTSGKDEPINRFYLSRSELSYMVQSGRWELESHGDADHALYDIASLSSTPGNVMTTPGGHFLSNLFWLSDQERIETPQEYAARVADDLDTSKRALQDVFGITVDSFAFPFDDFGQNYINYPGAQAELARIAPSEYSFGFIQASPAKEDFFNYPDPNTFFIKRLEPSASWSGADLLSALEDAGPRQLPYASDSFGSEWNTNWGSTGAKSDGSLALLATSRTTGAIALLSGSSWWTDYTASATADIGEGDFSLLGRYDPANDSFIACTLSNGNLLLQERRRGEQHAVASAPYTRKSGSQRSITLAIQGSAASCSAEGASVSAAVTAPPSGALGVEVWAPRPGLAKADLTHIQASKP